MRLNAKKLNEIFVFYKKRFKILMPDQKCVGF